MKTVPRAVLFALLRGETRPERIAADFGLTVEEVERVKTAFVDGLDAGSASSKRRSLRSMAVAVVVATIVLLAPRAFSGTCATPPFFSALGLTFFCANEPALASEANDNTQQLVTLVAAKVGALGPADGGVSGIVASSITSPKETVSYFTPPYAPWVGSGAQVGAGGAAIVNDNTTSNGLMLVGNTAGGGARRQVKVYDDLTVTGRLTVVDKQCRTFNSGCQSSGTLEFFDRHVMLCGTDEVMKGFAANNCGGSISFAVTCCRY